MSSWLSFLQPRQWSRLARAVFGEMNYSPPSWPLSIFDTMRKHPGRWASLIVLTGVAVGGGVKGYEWWQLRKPQPMLRCLPQPERVAQLLVTQWREATGGGAQAVAVPASVPASPAANPAASPASVRDTALATH